MAHETRDLPTRRVGAKLLFAVNPPEFFCSHRLPVARAALSDGFDVAVTCAPDRWTNEIVSAGVRHIPLAMPRGFAGFFDELKGFFELFSIFRKERPCVVHLVTPKLLLFGGICARLLRIPTVAAVSGLGHLFTDMRPGSSVVRTALLLGLRVALRRKDAIIIFQNQSDRDIFVTAGIAVDGQHVLIPGSGTDLKRFRPAPRSVKTPTVILPARLLETKGIREFADAARILKRQGISARFVLQGGIDPANPASASPEQLRSWSEEGILTVQPHRKDIENALRQSDIVVLPSYREGFPKTLIDAAAAGLPAVTTDVPGCRDAVIDGKTGLVVECKNSQALARAIATLINDSCLRKRMGAAARRLAEERFDMRDVATQHLQIYRTLLKNGQS